MVGTAAGAKKIFRVVEQIQFKDIQKQTHGYFGMLGIGKFGVAPLPDPFESTSSITHS